MAPASFQQTSNSTVCVMNASGRLGSTLVQRLLQRGYTIHATVQHHDESQLNRLCCDNTKLKIFRSDPFDYQSIIDALKGCSGLFYAFEPPQDQPAYDEYMVEVEVRAAHNVLEACAQTESIEKVVFTSSATAVVWRDDRKSMASDLEERHWSDVNLCRKFKLWHGLSKTVAEKTAWALAMDRGVNMVSLNTGLLMGGPDLSITHPYLKGTAEMYEDGVFVTVDLDFLVDAHICVFENISSHGRYLCFNHVINRHEDALKLAHMLAYPSAPPALPQSHEQVMRIIQQRISNKKLNQLMVDFESCGSTTRKMYFYGSLKSPQQARKSSLIQFYRNISLAGSLPRLQPHIYALCRRLRSSQITEANNVDFDAGKTRQICRCKSHAWN